MKTIRKIYGVHGCVYFLLRLCLLFLRPCNSKQRRKKLLDIAHAHAIGTCQRHFMMIIWSIATSLQMYAESHSVWKFSSIWFRMHTLLNSCRKTRPILFISLNKRHCTIQKKIRSRKKTIEIKLRAREQAVCAHAYENNINSDNTLKNTHTYLCEYIHTQWDVSTQEKGKHSYSVR